MRSLLVGVLAFGCVTREPEPLPTPVVKLPVPISLDAGVIELDGGDPPPRGPGEQYTTRFRTTGDGAKRDHNIRLVAYKMGHARYVKAGTEFSFNEAIGPRTVEAGFGMAPAFFEGVHQDSLGGGICQVSSTLYAVLMLAGYNVTEWHSHSRPVPYIEPGMDATVNWPDLDLKFIPDHDVWISVIVQKDDEPGFAKVSAVVSGGEVLRPEVRTKWVKQDVTPFTTRTVFSPYVKKPKVHRPGAVGTPGYRIWQWGDTVLRRDANYAPVQEVLIVPAVSPRASVSGVASAASGPVCTAAAGSSCPSP